MSMLLLLLLYLDASNDNVCFKIYFILIFYTCIWRTHIYGFEGHTLLRVEDKSVRHESEVGALHC